MDMRLLRLCNAFALQYKRAYSEALSVSEFEAGGKGAQSVAKALHSGDPRLVQACKELADAMGIQASIVPVRQSAPAKLAPKAGAIESVVALRAGKLFQGEPGITDKQWSLIEDCARQVAGPIADLWLDQAKAEGPESFKDAVVITSTKLGSFGKDFAVAIRQRLSA